MDFETYLKRTNRSDNTARIYSRRVAEFQASGCISMADWIVERRRAGASNSTLKALLAASKAFHDFQGMDRSELDRMGSPRVAGSKARPLPNGMNDVRHILQVTPNPVYRAAVALGALAGCRVSETISLGSRDLNANGSWLNINGKGDKFRDVPVSPELEAHLPPYVGLFVPLCNSGARKAITIAASKAGVFHADGSPVASHDLRATFATAVYEKTNDILTVQRLLGHSSVAQTQEYIGVNKRAMTEAVIL